MATLEVGRLLKGKARLDYCQARFSVVIGSHYGRASLETGTAPFTQLGGSFTLTPGLRRLIVFTPACFGKNTFLLHLAAELLQGDFKRAVGVNNYLSH